MAGAHTTAEHVLDATIRYSAWLAQDTHTAVAQKAMIKSNTVGIKNKFKSYMQTENGWFRLIFANENLRFSTLDIHFRVMQKQ